LSSPHFNWTYLNGHVAIGEDGHSKLLRDAADEVGLDGPTKAKIRSQWILGLPIEPGLKADVARGVMAPSGHAVIWESNVDRNAVRDAVEREYSRSPSGTQRAASSTWDEGRGLRQWGIVHSAGLDDSDASSVRLQEGISSDWVLDS
jgi:hypothetical protein